MDPALRHEAAFAAVATPSVFLDPDLVVRAANPAYLKAVSRSWEDLEGRHLFTVFPENPDDPEADGVAALTACLQHVLSGKGAECVPLQRYDVNRPGEPAGYVERYWSVIDSPVLDAEGELAGVLHQTQDVTAFRRHIARVLEDPDGVEGDEWRAAGAASVIAGVQRQQELRAENEQLHYALTSRAVIDQAIGIALAEHAGTPEEAFQRLVNVSQETNVKLRDVARALVARAAEPERPLVP